MLAPSQRDAELYSQRLGVAIAKIRLQQGLTSEAFALSVNFKPFEIKAIEEGSYIENYTLVIGDLLHEMHIKDTKALFAKANMRNDSTITISANDGVKPAHGETEKTAEKRPTRHYRKRTVTEPLATATTSDMDFRNRVMETSISNAKGVISR